MYLASRDTYCLVFNIGNSKYFNRWVDEPVRTFIMAFLMAGCVRPVAPFQSQDLPRAERRLTFSSSLWKRKLGALPFFSTPEPPLGYSPVSMSHSWFCMEAKALGGGSNSSTPLLEVDNPFRLLSSSPERIRVQDSNTETNSLSLECLDQGDVAFGPDSSPPWAARTLFSAIVGASVVDFLSGVVCP